MLKQVTSFSGCLLFLVATMPVASAQSTIAKFVVPFAAGGGQDVLARVIAPQLGAQLGWTFLVENRAGAGGAIAASDVARSKPDGTTLLMAASSLTISAALDRNLPFDPVTDFTAVAHIGTGAYIFLVNASLPVKTVAEFVAYAKTQPGRLNYGSAGVGSATHLAMAYFATRTQLNVVHVPFKSTAEALNSLIGGDTQVLVVPTLGSQAFVANPAIRLIAVVSKERISMFPNVPTVSESGLPSFQFTSWFGLLGPSKMPAGLTRTLHDAIKRHRGGLSGPVHFCAASLRQVTAGSVVHFATVIYIWSQRCDFFSTADANSNRPAQGILCAKRRASFCASNRLEIQRADGPSSSSTVHNRASEVIARKCRSSQGNRVKAITLR